MSPKKRTVVLLRWVLIIAFSYLLLLDASASHPQARLVALIAAVLTSNLVVGRLPDRWLITRLFDFGVVLFDAAWVTLGLLWAPNVSGDLFLLYFLVIFVAAVGESLPMIVGSAVLVSLVYGVTLSFHSGEDLRLVTTALLRVPFLFVVALFYGYFVTELRGRRNEAAEARLREQAKSELLAAVSHDLRGPLGNAENLLAMVLETQMDGEVPDRSLLLRTQVNVRRVSSLVSNLLQAACIEAGHVYFQLAPVQLNDIVDDVVALEGGAAVLKGVTLTREANPNLPAVTVDQMQVGRILTNLVNNAIKYTSAGGAVLIRTGCDEQQVYIGVQDDGPGMRPEQSQDLFGAYRRGQLSSYTSGTGLGLYIVKRLTEAQGGTVTVQSALGTGSTFTVAFPRAPRPEEAPARVPGRKSVPVVLSSTLHQPAAAVG
jgi:signal transduction histidine kinase